MDIKDLPKAGAGFKASLNRSGTPSFKKALTKLAVKNSNFQNLDKGNVDTIVKAIEPFEKSIRLKGGLSRLQIKSVTKNLRKELSKQDIRDAKEILATYKKGANDKKDSAKKAVPFRPYLDQDQTPKIGMNSISEKSHGVSSISDIVNSKPSKSIIPPSSVMPKIIPRIKF